MNFFLGGLEDTEQDKQFPNTHKGRYLSSFEKLVKTTIKLSSKNEKDLVKQCIYMWKDVNCSMILDFLLSGTIMKMIVTLFSEWRAWSVPDFETIMTSHIDGLRKLRIIIGNEEVMINVSLVLNIFVTALDRLRKVQINRIINGLYKPFSF